MDLFPIIKTFLLVSLVFIPLERLFALKRGQKIFRPGWRVDILHVFLTGLLVQFGHITLIAVSSQLLHQTLVEPYLPTLSNQPIWLQYIEVLIIADLGFYGMHRAFHSVPWLWRFHTVHHSSERLDYLAAYRVHPFDQFMVRSVTLIPVFSLGFDTATYVIFATLYHWHAMILHANIKWRFGWLERIIATPCFHHWHHSKHDDTGHNFAGQLAIIDKVFGTFSTPGNKMPTEYGINEPMPQNYVDQLTHPFKRERTVQELQDNKNEI